MPETPHPAACACPRCATPCTWTPERAGRRLRCPCGQIFRLPAQPGQPLTADSAPPTQREATPPASATPKPARASAAPEPEVYEVDLPEDLRGPTPAGASPPPAPGPAPAPAPTKCPSCNGVLRSGAIICMNCGFNLAEGRKIQTRIEADSDPA